MRERFGPMVVCAGALLMVGCPGSIEDPLEFRRSAANACPDDFDVEQDLFKRTCGDLGCHTGGPSVAAAGLDLSAPGVGERMLLHTSDECGGIALIDRHHVESSYLIAKLGDDPLCGDRMPSGGGALNATERACLDQYLESLLGWASDAGLPPPEPPADAGARADGAAVATPVTIQAESMGLMGYAVDPADESMIRIPDGSTTGSASTTFTDAAARYTLHVHVGAESDGQPTLTIRVGDTEVVSETYPLGTEDVEPAVLGPYQVDLAPGDVITLEGQVDGGAWARVDRLELVP